MEPKKNHVTKKKTIFKIYLFMFILRCIIHFITNFAYLTYVLFRFYNNFGTIIFVRRCPILNTKKSLSGWNCSGQKCVPWSDWERTDKKWWVPVEKYDIRRNKPRLGYFLFKFEQILKLMFFGDWNKIFERVVFLNVWWKRCSGIILTSKNLEILYLRQKWSKKGLFFLVPWFFWFIFENSGFFYNSIKFIFLNLCYKLKLLFYVSG